ncbi:MAG: 7-cyano-7-deazaguanine synthase QueC [Candidatus Omnitrophota bacterium]|nr:MAG: 7-cyano-7-deazaguanine synthase QueC [Candidatus Omnitrophota bacterium]
MKKAIVLLSGGLDSATALYIAKNRGYCCLCLIFDYGQRHIREILSAKRIAQKAKCAFEILKIKLPWEGSSLLDNRIKIPQVTKSQSHKVTKEIPNTYVPGRNIIFLSFALSYAEAVGAEAIFIGANAVDFSGYPDCRPLFYQAYRKVINTGTLLGLSGKDIRILTPLIYKSKAEIIKVGKKLGVPFELTWSCYRGSSKPCGKCDSCIFRQRGFRQAKLKDPLLA